MVKKVKVIIPIAAGDYLTEVDYHVYQPQQERHRKLIKAVKAHNYRAIVLRLNAISIRLRNTEPETYKKLRADMSYLKKYFKK